MSDNILIVEEHPALRKALRDWLTFSFSNYHTLTSSCYDDAINRIKNDSPQLVIIDFNMPEIKHNAIQIIKGFAPSCKIVVLTFIEDESYRAMFMSAGADALVSKQTLGTSLIPTAKALLNGSIRL